MSNEYVTRETIPIEEATVSKMLGIAGIVEICERKAKEGTTMNVFDRIILSSIALGIWAWVLITFLSGKHIDC